MLHNSPLHHCMEPFTAYNCPQDSHPHGVPWGINLQILTHTKRDIISSYGTHDSQIADEQHSKSLYLLLIKPFLHLKIQLTYSALFFIQKNRYKASIPTCQNTSTHASCRKWCLFIKVLLYYKHGSLNITFSNNMHTDRKPTIENVCSSLEFYLTISKLTTPTSNIQN